MTPELTALVAQGITDEQLAVWFHETYERLAPEFGYETRPDTKAFDPQSKNGKLMVAVCGKAAAALREQAKDAKYCQEHHVSRQLLDATNDSLREQAGEVTELKQKVIESQAALYRTSAAGFDVVRERDSLRATLATQAAEIERFKVGLIEQRSYSAELFAERETQAATIEALRKDIARVKKVPRYKDGGCNEYPECRHRGCWTAFAWADDLDAALMTESKP